MLNILIDYNFLFNIKNNTKELCNEPENNINLIRDTSYTPNMFHVLFYVLRIQQ